MLAAYLDESADEFQFSVCGWMAPAAEWERFTASWRKLLDSLDVATLGLSDLMSSKKKPFSSWSPEKRDATLSSCINLIRKHTSIAVHATIHVPDLTSVLDGEAAAIGIQPVGLGAVDQIAYMACGLACVSAIVVFASPRCEEPVRVTFEKGRKGIGTIRDVAARIHAENHNRQVVSVLPSADKRDVVALQAADFFACAHTRYARRIVKERNRHAALPALTVRVVGRRPRVIGGFIPSDRIRSVLSRFLAKDIRSVDLARILRAMTTLAPRSDDYAGGA